jgi:hypothetical protein
LGICAVENICALDGERCSRVEEMLFRGPDSGPPSLKVIRIMKSNWRRWTSLVGGENFTSKTLRKKTTCKI